MEQQIQYQIKEQEAIDSPLESRGRNGGGNREKKSLDQIKFEIVTYNDGLKEGEDTIYREQHVKQYQKVVVQLINSKINKNTAKQQTIKRRQIKVMREKLLSKQIL